MSKSLAAAHALLAKSLPGRLDIQELAGLNVL